MLLFPSHALVFQQWDTNVTCMHSRCFASFRKVVQRPAFIGNLLKAKRRTLPSYCAKLQGLACTGTCDELKQIMRTPLPQIGQRVRRRTIFIPAMNRECLAS